MNLGPFNIAQLFRDPTQPGEFQFDGSPFDGFYTALINEVEEKWLEALKQRHKHYNDDPDLVNWSQSSEMFRAYREAESCVIKFFPRVINTNIPFPVTEVTQIQPGIISIDSTTHGFNIPSIPLHGDAPFLQLSNTYQRAPLPNDPIGYSSFRFLPNDHLITGRVRAIKDYDDTGDDEITLGRLSHYALNPNQWITKTTHSVKDDHIIPPNVLTHAPPRKVINRELSPNELAEILFVDPNPIDTVIEPAVTAANNDDDFWYDLQTQKEGNFEDDQVQEIFDDSPDSNDPWVRVGCILNKKNKLEQTLLRNAGLWDPPNTIDSNCFLRCLREALITLHYPDPCEEEDYTKWRLSLQIDHQNHLDGIDLQHISNLLNYQFALYAIVDIKINETTKEISREETQMKQHIVKSNTISPEGVNYETTIFSFLFHKEHCYLIKKPDLITKKVKCAACAQWIIKENFSVHAASCYYCSTCSHSYKKNDKQEHICKDAAHKRLTPNEFKQKMINKRKEVVSQDWISMDPVAKGKRKMASRKIWFSDFEAFPNSEDEQFFAPYAIGLMCLAHLKEEKIKIFYGENCMHDYLHYLTASVEGKLYYYNGCRFDNYIHLKGMVDYSFYIDPNSFVKMGGKILTFKHKDRLQVFDLCLFTQEPLKDACVSWGVPRDKSKKDFDHEKIKSYKDAALHEKEVREYLKYDIISLAHLFNIYHNAMWECFSIDMAKCVTPATFALKAWSATSYDLKEFYVPHFGKEEDDDRAAYYGGRVMCQYKEYESKNFRESDVFHPYDWIDDYIVIGDVNSLYPAVQHSQLYAYGKWKYEDYKHGSDDERAYCESLNNFEFYSRSSHPIDEHFFVKRCFRVDIKCPTNIITSFLMERNAQGEIIHNLLDKQGQWYWGPELEEAIILGYKVTRVYEVKVFEKCGPIFKDYIDKCWNERKKHPSGTAKNLCFKFAMNGLTGKFGQKSHKSNTVIYSTSHEPDEERMKVWEEMIKNVIDFEPLYSKPINAKQGENAILLEYLSDNPGPRYPIYFSAQILAYARVHMSKIMRACDAYTNPQRAIYYTDTDSLVLPSQCIPPLITAGFVGKALGQLKCDLNGKFSDDTKEFAKIVSAVWAATKGPYSLAYVLPGQDTVMEKIKVKGIPHIDEPVKYYDPVQFELDADQEMLLKRVKRWLANPHTYQLPGAIIGQKFYLFQDSTKTLSYYAKNINQRMIKLIMKNEGYVYAYYGGMKKEFTAGDGRFLMIRPTAVMRTVCKTNWWEKNKRIYLTETHHNTDLSFPVGYIQ